MAHSENDDNLSISTFLSDVDDNSAIVDFPSYNYFIGIKLELIKKDNQNEIVIYSHINGVERHQLHVSSNVDDMKKVDILKCRRMGDQLQVLPIKFFVANHACASISYKYKRDRTTMKLTTFAVLGLRSNPHDEYVFWSDVIGDIRSTARDILKIFPAAHQLGSLELLELSVCADFMLMHGFQPRWKVENIAPFRQSRKEEEKTIAIPFHIYPVRCIRFDDVHYKKRIGENFLFSLISNADIDIHARRSQMVSGTGVMTAIVFPKFGIDQKVHYFEALAIGLKESVISVTSERFFNFKPKSFEPYLLEIHAGIIKTKKEMDAQAREIRSRRGFTFAS